jgi:membrane protein
VTGLCYFDSYNRVYGSLGAGVGFMTWIWLSVVIVLLGAELNAATHPCERNRPARASILGRTDGVGREGLA